MKYAYFPNIYYLDYTFEDSPLISIDCPLVYEITSAFKNCYSLEFLNLPSLSEISNCAFQNCNKLTEFDFSNITYLGKNALSYSNFRDISLPNLIELNGTGCFSYCNAETISIPQIEILKESTFRGAKNLKHIDMPNYTDCEAVAVSYKVLRVFEDNYSLEELYIPNAVLRIKLVKFILTFCYDFTFFVENNSTGAGCSLVKCHYKFFCHSKILSSLYNISLLILS